MKCFFLCLAIFASSFIFSGEAQPLEIHLTLEDCLFVKYPVPEKGIVCSNYDRAIRLSNKLSDAVMHKCPWGPFVVIGNYQGEKIFVACASVGAGSGLLFTELYVAGAKYIIRYGSDDVKSPPATDAYLVKIVDEADNLYGFNIQSGVDPEEWGMAVQASSKIIQALIVEAKLRNINYEMRICHHLENYHGLRSPNKFSERRKAALEAILDKLNENPKPSSYDMETAVLFRVAKDFNLHAATILQTVNKESKQLNLNSDDDFKQIIEVEEGIFFNYVLSALLKI